jgi:hypothetical protein
MLQNHGGSNLLGLCEQKLKEVGLGAKDLFIRFAGHCGDGALEGHFGLGLGEIAAKRWRLPADAGWGALDCMHSCDKSGYHADFLDRGRDGLIHRFHEAATLIKKDLGYGRGRAVTRAASSKLGLLWRQPLAPHSQSTRLIIFESSRIADNFLRNVPVAVYSFAFLLQSELAHARANSKTNNEKTGLMSKIARELRATGRKILDLEMLLFET